MYSAADDLAELYPEISLLAWIGRDNFYFNWRIKCCEMWHAQRFTNFLSLFLYKYLSLEELVLQPKKYPKELQPGGKRILSVP